MFRIMNARDNELVELHASVVMSRFENGQRRYHPLSLDRERVTFFPLNWTVVHPIDENSPLYGWDEHMLQHSEAEFLILLTATDETFAQVVHNRSSYTTDEVIWSARFLPLMDADSDGVPRLRLERFHDFERV